jgi:hypothetical protein
LHTVARGSLANRRELAFTRGVPTTPHTIDPSAQRRYLIQMSEAMQRQFVTLANTHLDPAFELGCRPLMVEARHEQQGQRQPSVAFDPGDESLATLLGRWRNVMDRHAHFLATAQRSALDRSRSISAGNTLLVRSEAVTSTAIHSRLFAPRFDPHQQL